MLESNLSVTGGGFFWWNVNPGHPGSQMHYQRFLPISPPHVACLAAWLLYLTRTPKINDLPVKMPIDQVRSF